MCCVPRVTCPALEATSHPSRPVGLWHARGSVSGSSQHIPVPLQAEVPRGEPISVEALGRVEGTQRTLLAPRCLLRSGEELFAEPSAPLFLGEASLRKAIWRGAAAEPRLRDPAGAQGFDAHGKCGVSPHSQPHQSAGYWDALPLIQRQRNMVVLSSLALLAGLFPAGGDDQPSHVPKI